MISDEIANLADLLITEAALNGPLPPQRAAAIAGRLLGLAERVRVMEGEPISLNLREPIQHDPNAPIMNTGTVTVRSQWSTLDGIPIQPSIRGDV